MGLEISGNEKNENQAQKPSISQEEANKKWQESSSKINKIREAERLDSIKDELMRVWKLDTQKPKASFLFPDKNGNKENMKIDMTAQTLEFQGKTIKIELPKGATMSNILFSGEGVKIEGKLWFFSGSGSASYEKLIQAIDTVVENGSYKLIAGKEEIWFRLV